METIFATSDLSFDSEPGIIKCPCSKWGLIENNYTTNPMIWCDGCGGRYVIDCGTMKEIDERPEVELESDVDFYVGDSDRFYSVNLCYIKRLCNSDLENYRLTSQDINNIDELLELKSEMYFDDEKIQQVEEKIKELGFVECETNYYPWRNIENIESGNYMTAKNIKIGFDKEPHDIEYIPFKLYVSIDSYNVVDPKVPHKANTDHGGIPIYLDCVNSTGTEFRVEYDGD